MTSRIENLQALATKWGNQSSKRNGTTCRWVKLHAEGWGMGQYPQYKISTKVLNVQYDPKYQEVPLPGQILTSSFKNNSDGVGSAHFKKTSQTTTSFSWSITEGLEVGISEEITAGVPEVAQSKTTLSMKMSLSSTQGQTKSETTGWEIDRTISVPPHESIEMTWAINESRITAVFHADIEITGFFAIWNNDKVNGHWLYFVPVANAFRQMKAWGMSIPSQFSIEGNSVIFHAKGECTGQLGVSDVFSVKNTRGSEMLLADMPIDVPEEELVSS